ncbi:MAG: class I SAM-dependent methyltransferase [Rhodomicrobium sp.]|nr:class I SAM-dependent methyltransferase [Rhodomicrobium sp.]
MAASPRFWDRIAERYAKQPIADEAAYRRKLQITQSYLRPDMDVLELGCGTGSTALIHAPFVKHIIATDASKKMIEIAQRKADEAGAANVTFRRISAEEFSAPDASFDVILGLSLLHLVEDRQAVMAKILKLLKPGGVFVSNTACLGDTMGYFKLIAPVGYWLGLLPLVRVFKTNEFVRDLKAAGFSIEQQWQPGRGKAVFIVAKKAM